VGKRGPEDAGQDSQRGSARRPRQDGDDEVSARLNVRSGESKTQSIEIRRVYPHHASPSISLKTDVGWHPGENMQLPYLLDSRSR
jgi:hypothetical protein